MEGIEGWGWGERNGQHGRKDAWATIAWLVVAWKGGEIDDL